MGGINSLSGLNKVEVDFRPTVEPAAPKNVDAGQQQPAEPDVAVEDNQPVQANAKSVVQELDVLLLNAAGKSVSADAATKVKTAGKELVDLGVLGEDEVSKLESLANTATEKLKALDISFRIPYARVLSDEESQKEDEEEIGAAIRMAILLMSTVESRGEASRISVACNDRGTSYVVYSADGEVEDSGADWTPLVKRLEAELGDAPDSLSIIWP